MTTARRDPPRHELPEIDGPALTAASATDKALAAAMDSGIERWARYLAPLPDRLRDDPLRELRGAARLVRAAYGPRDSIRDALPEEVTEPMLDAIDRLLRAIARHDAQR